MANICRTCLEEILGDSPKFDLNAEETARDQVSIQLKLSACVPELNLNIIPSAVICADCLSAIDSAHKFKKKCLKSEERINNYLQQTHISLYEIVGRPKESSDVIPFVPCKQEFEEDLDSNETDVLRTEFVSATVVAEVNEDCDNPIRLEENEEPSFIDVKNECFVDEIVNPENIEVAAVPKLYKCNKCDYSNVLRNKLKLHKKTHSLSQLYKCTQCEYSSNWKQSLINHMATHTGVGEKSFKCIQCKYSTNITSNLTAHMKTHSKDKPYKCSECQYSCNNRSNLATHMQTHTTDKRYDCSECDYSTNWRTSIIQHVRVHKAQRPFKCLHCNYKSMRKDVLAAHMRRHTGEKPYKCSVCKFSSAQLVNLKSHMKTRHIGVEMFQCKKCSFACSNKRELNLHAASHNE